MNTQKTEVWDLFVRVFHWSLLFCFVVAYVTGEGEWEVLHVNAGYAIFLLIVMRVLWGIIGSRYARFNDFVRRPTEVLAYMKALIAGREKRYLGHNPAGGLMIILLLLSLVLTGLTGLIVYAAEDGAGPLAGLALQGEFWEGAGEELHEFFANFTVLLVIIHVAGVVFESIRHGENLVTAMLSGRKKSEI